MIESSSTFGNNTISSSKNLTAVDIDNSIIKFNQSKIISNQGITHGITREDMPKPRTKNCESIKVTSGVNFSEHAPGSCGKSMYFPLSFSISFF